MSKGKFLAVDFGDKRVGIAISDQNKEISFPRDFFEYRKMQELLDYLSGLCQEEGVIRIILGLPIHMDGRLGERAERTQQFFDQLKSVMPTMDIVFFDERLSTEFAVKSLRGMGIRAKDQKGKRDTLSAQIILQNYLTALRNGQAHEL